MRELIIAEFITLDGVIQAPGGADEDTEGGFSHGGWTQPYWHDEIGVHFFQAMSRADALLLGRKTWQIHGGAFEPMVGDPFGDAMNNIRKYVVSTTLETASAWRNSTLIGDNVVEAIRQLKQQPGMNILLAAAACWLIHWHRMIWWMSTNCTFIPWCWAAANDCSRRGSASTWHWWRRRPCRQASCSCATGVRHRVGPGL